MLPSPPRPALPPPSIRRAPPRQDARVRAVLRALLLAPPESADEAERAVTRIMERIRAG